MFVAVLAWGCSERGAGLRRPGPHEDERGLTTVWDVGEQWAEEEDCTWRAGFSEAVLEDFPDDGAGWFAYRLGEHGGYAEELDCGMLRDDYCHGRGVDWDVSGHVLSREMSGGPGLYLWDLYEGDCSARAVGTAHLRDAGDRAVLVWEAQMRYDGLNCADVEDSFGPACRGRLTVGLTHRATF